jgi:hypothetical protein
MTAEIGTKAASARASASIAGLWRKHVLCASLWLLAWPMMALAEPGSRTLAPTTEATEASSARVVTMTYLKSAPGKLGQLERYVRANWFAMDKIAVERGLFVSYLWLDTGSDEGPWNAVVMVTYRDAQGFAGIEQEWAGIKAAHREVLIDGARQADLGRVVESREFFERAPFVNVVAAGIPTDEAASDAHSRDESAIREVVGKYFEAGITGSPGLIREAFLPTARIEGLRGERLVTWSFDEYIRFFNGTPASGADQVERTITRVMTHGSSATVHLRLRFSPAQALDEQLLLLRIDGRWKIAYKSYTPSP